MKHAKERINVDLTLSPNDAMRLRNYLDRTGRRMVPFVRSFVLTTLDEWEREKKDQASDLREMMEVNS